MNILDENIDFFTRQQLAQWKFHFRQIGLEIGHSGMKDFDEILPLLHSLRRPTLLTRDDDFYHPQLRHAHYCLAYFEVARSKTAEYIRHFYRHPLFRHKPNEWEALRVYMKTGSPIGNLMHEEQTELFGNPPITMKSITILTCAILCLLQPAFAQKAAKPPPTSTTSTIETVRCDGREFVVTTNRKFKYVPLYSGDGESWLLLLEELRTEISRDAEGSNSTMKVDA